MPSVIIKRARVLCLGALLLLTACARPVPAHDKMPVSVLPATGDFITAAGDAIAPEDFRKRTAEADYVLIGESHGQICDHAAERRILVLMAHNAKPPAVGLEMVPRDHSGVIKDFAAGLVDPADLKDRLDWSKTWGHPFERYLPVFLTIRDWKLPVAGLNVPPGVIRKLSAAAMDNATAPGDFDAAAAALTPEDRRWLPEHIVPPAPEQLAFLREVMDGHPQGRNVDDARRMARFELIQSVWDSGMAEQAVRLRKNTGRPVAILAGTAHVEGGLGIARRIRLREPDARILLVSPWRGDDLDPKDADLRVYCPESFESRMGMTLEKRPLAMPAQDDRDWQVVVTAVRRGSRADLAGLRPGDVVLAAGGYRMRSLNALHLAGSDAFRAKKNLVLEIRRGRECYEVDLGPLGVPSGPQAGSK
jgi:uncharacterized iron-regulated protein